jgi:hypothetical protein
MLCVTRMNPDLERTGGHAVRAAYHTRRCARLPCSRNFGSMNASVSGVANTGPLILRQHVRNGADVIPVAVRQHEGRNRPLLQIREIR